MANTLIPVSDDFDIEAELISATIGLPTGGHIHIASEGYTDLHNVIMDLFDRYWVVEEGPYEWPEALALAADFAARVNEGERAPCPVRVADVKVNAQ
jgi:hypothetical protein